MAEGKSLMSKSSFNVHLAQRSATLTVRSYVNATSRNRNLSIFNTLEPITLEEEYV
jgi:hypothetical protein